MMVGAPDMALARMNNLSFGSLPFAFGVMLSSLFMEGGAPNLVGHFTLHYPQLTHHQVLLSLFSLYIFLVHPQLWVPLM